MSLKPASRTHGKKNEGEIKKNDIIKIKCPTQRKKVIKLFFWFCLLKLSSFKDQTMLASRNIIIKHLGARDFLFQSHINKFKAEKSLLQASKGEDKEGTPLASP